MEKKLTPCQKIFEGVANGEITFMDFITKEFKEKFLAEEEQNYKESFLAAREQKSSEVAGSETLYSKYVSFEEYFNSTYKSNK